jgi:hypothetical protein
MNRKFVSCVAAEKKIKITYWGLKRQRFRRRVFWERDSVTSVKKYVSGGSKKKKTPWP